MKFVVKTQERRPVYRASVLAEIENPGAWSSTRVGVFRIAEGGQEQVGEYVRNYPVFYNTFYPFRFGETDLALYSPDYTATRIMELPSCRDLGGEERDPHGFCPVDYVVPSFVERESVNQGKVIRYRVNNPRPPSSTQQTVRAEAEEQETSDDGSNGLVTPETFYQFGFVAGCQWGDDRSWKVQFLDLSGAVNGILKRDNRFGYIELPHKLPLAEALYLYRVPPDESLRLAVTIEKRFEIETGRPIEPFDE